MKNMYKYILSIVTLLTLSVGSAWAETVTVTVTPTAISGTSGIVKWNAYKGGGTSDPAISSSCIRLYQNAAGNTAGFIVIQLTDANYKIKSVSITSGSSYSTTVGYVLSNSTATTAKASYAVSDYSLAKSSTYTVSGLNTLYITFANFGTSKSARLDIASFSVTYESATTKSDPAFSIENITVAKDGDILPVITTSNTDSYSITYTSDDENIVIADGDELVTGDNTGTCTITATMAATDNFNAATTTFTVTVNAAATAHTITYVVSSPCVTSPSGSTADQLTYATATPAIDGYTFEGWTTQTPASYTSSSTKPTGLDDRNSGDNTVDDETVYGVYSTNSGTVSGVTFEILRGAGVTVTSGHWYVISNGQANATTGQPVVGNEYYSYTSDGVTYTKIQGITSNATSEASEITVNSLGAIYRIVGDATNGYTLQNWQTKTYLSLNMKGDPVAIGKNELVLVSTPDEYALWDISIWNEATGTSGGNTFYIQSHYDTDYYLKLTSATTSAPPFWGATTGGTEQAKYLFSVSTEPLSDTKTYYINPTCPTENWTVSFNMQGYGSAIASQDIENGSTATKPTDPTSDCATFGGWYTEAACTNEFNFSTPITADKTLYAKWIKKSFNLAWELDGGTEQTAGTTAGSVVGGATLTAPTVTKDGYTFKAWSPTVPSTMPCAAATYTATWEKNTTYVYFTECGSATTATLHFEANCTPTSGAVPSNITEVTLNAAYTLPDNTGSLVRTGYKFVGWNVSSSATTAQTTITPTEAKTYTLYAIWQVNQHTVTYNGNGSTGGNVPATATDYNYGAEVTVLGNTGTLVNGDKTFTGWNTAADGSGTAYSAADKFSMPNENVTLYAQWATAYTVTYSVPTDGGTQPDADIVHQGESITLPNIIDCSFTCAKFLGWYASTYSSSTKPTILAAGSSYIPEADVTLYAIYGVLGDTYTLVEDADDLVVGSNVVIAYREYDEDLGWFLTAMSETQSTDYRTAYTATSTNSNGTTITWTEATPDVCELELQAGSVENTYALYDSGTTKGYLYAASSSSNLLKTQSSLDANASFSITINTSTYVATIEAQGSNTRNLLRYNYNNGSTPRFTCYSTGQSIPSIFQKSISTYTTSPTCVDYKVTLVVTGPTGGSATIIDKTATPGTNQTKTITSTSVNITNIADVLGYSYAVTANAGASVGTVSGGSVEISNISGATTVTVTYTALSSHAIIYNVGNSETTIPNGSAYMGETVNLTTTTPTPACTNATFVGWAENPATDGTKPAPLYAAGADYVMPTDADHTLYAVYATSDGCTAPFSISKSTEGTYTGTLKGEYYLTDGAATPCYATNWTYGYPYARTQAQIAADAGIAYAKFTLQYVGCKSDPENGVYKFTIYVEANKYNDVSTKYSGYWTGTGDVLSLSTEPYYWTIAPSGDNFTLKADSKYVYNNSGKFALSSSGVVNFEPASVQSYYTSPTCEGKTITAQFLWSSGMKSWPTSSLTRSGDTYTNLTTCYRLTEFPTPNTPTGWTFIGWQTSDYNTEIGLENLDDESATDVFPDRSTIYGGESGNDAYQMGTQNVVFYPIFTKFDDNDNIDPTTAGSSFEAYIYFYADAKSIYHDEYYDVLEHSTRIYAQDFTNGKANAEIDKKFGYTALCSDAQKFIFEKDGSGWNIRIKYDDANYLNKSYLTNTSGTDFDNVELEPDAVWSLTKNSGGDYSIYYTGNSSNPTTVGVDGTATCNSGEERNCVYYQIKVREQDGSWDFQCFHTDQSGSTYYYKVYLGSCENRKFSSNPGEAPLEAQVVEWAANSVKIMYTGSGTTATTKVGSNDASAAQTLSDENVNIDHCVYNLSASGLSSNAGANLEFAVGSAKKTFTIPYIVTTTGNTTDAMASNDVVVLDGATLTAVNGHSCNTLHIYPGAKFVVPASVTFSTSSIILRGGSSWGADPYEYKYPQLYLASTGTLTNAGGLYYDYVTTKAQYYSLSLPFAGSISDIAYPSDIYGSDAGAGSFQIKAYDGKLRADNDAVVDNVWYDVEKGNKSSGGYNDVITSLVPGQGYVFCGMPKKILKVGDSGKTRQTYGIQRITMTSVDFKNETSDKVVTVTASKAAHDNNSGWNAIGNPFMADYTAENSLGLGERASDGDEYGQLVEIKENGNWNGYYEWTGKTRYVTIPSNDQTSYEQYAVKNYTLPAFKHFFVQIGTGDAINFATASRKADAPRREKVSTLIEEIETGILLKSNSETDNAGLLIGDDYAEEYELDDDLVKVLGIGDTLAVYTIMGGYNLAFNALPINLAKGTIPVGVILPSAAQYTFSFDTVYNANDIKSLLLVDYDNSNATTDLLKNDYVFTSEGGTFNSRFALSVVFNSDEHTTDIDGISGERVVIYAVEGGLVLTDLPADAKVSLFDVVGHLISQDYVSQSLTKYMLPAGVYLVHVESTQGNSVVRALVK